MKKLVIFDLDGTLINTIDDLGCAANEALKALGYPTHPLSAYPMMVGNGVRRLMERALPGEAVSDEVLGRALDAFRAYYDEHLWDRSQPYPGITQLLEALKSHGVQMAVASNKYESAVQRLIAHFFPEIDFVAVYGHVEGVPVKPDPSIVFRILGDHPTLKDDVLYVGDSGVDMETARRAGVESVGVSWGFRPVRELQKAYADHIVADPDDIIEYIHL